MAKILDTYMNDKIYLLILAALLPQGYVIGFLLANGSYFCMSLLILDCVLLFIIMFENFKRITKNIMDIMDFKN